MSQYEVSFTETFVVNAASKDEAIAEARTLYQINLDRFDFTIPSNVSCEVIPKVLQQVKV